MNVGEMTEISIMELVELDSDEKEPEEMVVEEGDMINNEVRRTK